MHIPLEKSLCCKLLCIGANTVNFGILKEGDAIIAIMLSIFLTFHYLLNSYGKSCGQPRF